LLNFILPSLQLLQTRSGSEKKKPQDLHEIDMWDEFGVKKLGNIDSQDVERR